VREAELVRLLGRDGGGSCGRRFEDFRGAGPGFRNRRSTGSRLLWRLDEARRDAELAHGEVLVLLQHDSRRREERVALAPRVLGEERRFVRGELFAVAWVQVELVLVRDVDT